MNKIMKNLKNNKTSVIIILSSIAVICVMLYSIIQSTFAVEKSYDIIFHYAQTSKGILKTCKTDSSGKISSNCASFVNTICQTWSTEAWNGYSNPTNQSNEGTTSQIAAISHTSNMTYYCRTGTSTEKYPACLTCKADSSIYQWGIYRTYYFTDGSGRFSYIAEPQTNGTGDSCPNDEWTIDRSATEDSCSQCFQCKADSTIYKWATDAFGDGNCPGGYSKTTKSKAECKYVAPEPEPACYECKTDKTIVDWRTSDAGDNQCSAGYQKLEGITTEANCKYVAPPAPTYACYECKADKNIIRWKENAQGDNICPGGYNKTVKTKAQCEIEVPENPPTGTSRAIWVVLLASISMGCSIWYLKNNALSK